MTTQLFNLLTVAPEAALTLGAVLVLLIGTSKDVRPWTLKALTAFTLAMTAAALTKQALVLPDAVTSAGYGGMVTLDSTSILWVGLLYVVAILAFVMSWEFVEDHQTKAPEIVALMMLATAGFMFMVSAGHFMMLFLGLEVGSISLYILTALGSPSKDSDEAAMKYFLMGSMASGILLYGIALIYTGTGDLSYGGVFNSFNTALEAPGLILSGPFAGHTTGVPLVAVVGIALLLVGLLFKVTAAPFHFWAPDVYQGAPGRMVGFIAAAAKVAGFAAILRMVQFPLFPVFGKVQTPLVAVATVSVILGTLYAIRQDDVRRMLAYSGIAHAGFMLIGVSVGFIDVTTGNSGFPGTMFYLGTYSVTLVLTFGLLAVVSGDGRASIEQFRGLGRSSPVLAGSISIFMLSMSGMPLTSGFVGKFAVFSTAWVAGFHFVVVISLVMSVAAFFFYLRLIVAMYFEEGDATVSMALNQKVVVLAGVVMTIFLGTYPGPTIDFIIEALKL